MGPGVPIKIKEDRNYMKMTYEKARHIIELEEKRVDVDLKLEKVRIERKDNADSRMNTLKGLDLFASDDSWKILTAAATLILESLPKKSNEADLR